MITIRIGRIEAETFLPNKCSQTLAIHTFLGFMTFEPVNRN